MLTPFSDILWVAPGFLAVLQTCPGSPDLRTFALAVLVGWNTPPPASTSFRLLFKYHLSREVFLERCLSNSTQNRF